VGNFIAGEGVHNGKTWVDYKPLLVHVAHLKAFNKSLTKGLGSYAVLGDDIVISDRELANSYNYFMNYVLGVTAVLADYFKKKYNSILSWNCQY